MPLNRTEWDAILIAKDVDAQLEQLQQSGILRATFPSLQTLVGFGGEDSGHKDLWAHTRQVVKQTTPEPLLRWAALFHDVGKPQSFDRKDGVITFHGHEAASSRIFKQEARRSNLFTSEEVRDISFIVWHLGHVESYDPSWTDSAIRRLTNELGPHLDNVFAVARADCTTANPAKRKKILALTHELRTRVDALRAQDAIPPALPKGLGTALQQHLGIAAGPELGRVMAALKARVEAGELPRNSSIEVYLSAVNSRLGGPT